MWVCSLRVKRGTGRAFSLTLAYCFIQTSEVEEQLNKRLHARADQARLGMTKVTNCPYNVYSWADKSALAENFSVV